MPQAAVNQAVNKAQGVQKGADNENTSCLCISKICFCFFLSAGNCHDAPQGRKLIETIYSEDGHNLLADRAYEDDKTRKTAKNQGFNFVVPPKKTANNHGIMIKSFIKSVMRLNVTFLD